MIKPTRYPWSNYKSVEFLEKFQGLHQDLKSKICRIATFDLNASVDMLINLFQSAAASMKVRNTRKMYDTIMQPLWLDGEYDDLKQVKYTALRGRPAILYIKEKRIQKQMQNEKRTISISAT